MYVDTFIHIYVEWRSGARGPASASLCGGGSSISGAGRSAARSGGIRERQCDSLGSAHRWLSGYDRVE